MWIQEESLSADLIPMVGRAQDWYWLVLRQRMVRACMKKMMERYLRNRCAEFSQKKLGAGIRVENVPTCFSGVCWDSWERLGAVAEVRFICQT